MRSAVSLFLLAALGCAEAASAQTPAGVTVDDVRVTSDGRHRVEISVLDEGGDPVPGLERGFHVALDGKDVGPVAAVRMRTERPNTRLTLVIDAGLLRGESLAGVQGALRELGRSLAPGDRLRVVVAGSRIRSREANASAVESLAGSLAKDADDETPRLFDALYDAALTASHLPARMGAAIVVVTRGADSGSRHGSLDVHATARGRTRLTPILIAWVGGEGASSETDRLRRLAVSTGGGFAVVTSASDLSSRLPGLLRRGLDRWAVQFRADGWSRREPRHHLRVEVEHSGVRRGVDREYDTAEALPPSWWGSPLPWLLLVLILLFAGAAAALGRRRQLGLLVHDHDEDDGIWYEVYSFPITLGATTGNDILLLGHHVSRNHALLERRGRIVELVDLNSENGTFVNGERVVRRAIADGDRLSFGSAVHLIYEARG